MSLDFEHWVTFETSQRLIIRIRDYQKVRPRPLICCDFNSLCKPLLYHSSPGDVTTLAMDKLEAESGTKEKGRGERCAAMNRANARYLKWVEGQERFSKWLSDTTIHGTVHVFTAKTFLRRFLWGIIYTVAVGSCLYNVIDRISDFADRPSATTISLTTETQGIPFPAVTFCNLNFLRRSTAEMNQFTSVVDGIGSLNVSQCYVGVATSPPGVQDTPLRDILRNGSQPLDEFVKLCLFTGQGTNIFDCKNMLVPTLTDLGYCYSFNSEVSAPELFIRNTGSRYGLDLLLNISQGDYLPLLNSAGVRVAIHPRGVPPEPDERGIAVPPQRSAFIGLRTSTVTDVSTRKDCVEDRELPFFPGSRYSLPACRLNDLYDQVARNCCCLGLLNNTNIPTDQLCGTGSPLPNCTVMDACCMLEQVLTLNIGNDCPSACSYTTYEASTSYAEFPSMNGADSASQFLGLSLDDINSNTLFVTVFFEEPYIEQIKTTDSYTFTALISDIGGQLGLFLGASLISMIELGWFLADEVFDIFKKCCRKRKKKTSTASTNDMINNSNKTTPVPL